MYSKRPRTDEGESPAGRLAAMGYRELGYEPRSLELVLFDAARHAEEWEAFLPQTATGNLFQSRRFLAYHPPGRFQDHSLLFRREGKLVAVAAGELTGDAWSAHRFTSHGGIAARRSLRADACLDVVDALVQYARAQGWRSLRMRYPPACIHEGEAAVLFWALEVHGFRSEGRELSWYLAPGFADEEDLLSSYHSSARRGVRRARERGLVYRRSEDFAAYWKLLEANLKGRFEVAPTHTLAEIGRLRELCAGELELWAVFDPMRRMIAGSVVFDVSATAAHTFYFAQDGEAAEARPMSLLLHSLAVEFVIRRGVRLNLGVITAHGALELNLGLSRFKQNFGARPSIRRSFHLELGSAPRGG